MRVLIADRNARLLESISITFAHQFCIYTASTRKRCGDLLRQGEFDLAIVSEKLADGPGLRLLGQIARSSPNTLRIFAARRSRLQLLKGRLGRFGLFRTLSYPIDARKLLSALTLARAGLESDAPALKIRHVVMEERQANKVPATEPPSPARQRQNAASRPRKITPELAQPQRRAQQSALAQPGVARSVTPRRSPSQSETFQRALARREVAKRASSSQIVSRSSQRERRFAEARGGPIRPLAQSQPLGSLPKLVTAARPTHNARLAGAAPKRTTVFLGATIVVVFLATILTLSLFDGAAARSSSAQTTRITRVGGFSGPTPSVHPARSVAQPAVPKPDSTRPEVVALDPQMAASSTPIADPSTFGSEAFEPIYSN